MKRSLNVTYGFIPTNQTLINTQYWEYNISVLLLFNCLSKTLVLSFQLEKDVFFTLVKNKHKNCA